MNLHKFPRRRYIAGPTPIEKLERLSGLLGLNIYVKRDDLLGGLLGGGNKIRKLEYLMGDALSKGADTIITCGAPQSNHCRLTMAAAAKEGLDCQLVIEERVPGSYSQKASGNNLLFHLISDEKPHVVPGGSDIPGEMKQLAAKLEAQGRKPYVIPGGGSNDIGTLGYMSGALEILGQLNEMRLGIDMMVCTSGSGGTQIGLLLGLMTMQSGIPLTGIAISRKKDLQRDVLYKLCQQTADFLGLKCPAPEDIVVEDDYIGPGYSLPTEGMKEAVKLLARTEALLLDPVYTGKTMAGILDLASKNYFGSAKNILFLHTGGSPALYQCSGEFL